MKKILVIVFLCLAAISGFSQFNDTAYVYTYGGIQNDVCNQIKPTSDNGYIMIGTTNSFGCGGSNFYAIKVDSMGSHQWSQVYGGQLINEGFSVEQTFDGGYAFLGFTDSYGAGGYDVFLVKTDANGKQLWQKTYGGTDWDFGYSIKQLKDSGFIICGQTYSYGAGNGDVYVIRTDKNGDTLWTRSIGGTGYDIGNSVCVLRDSIYCIAGATTSYGNGYDTSAYFIELNSSGGIERTRTFGTTKNNAAYSIRGTTDNGLLLYGYTDSIPDSLTALRQSEILIKTDSTGKTEWTQIFYSTYFTGVGKDAVQLPDGYLMTTGTAVAFQISSMHIQNLYPVGYWMAGLLFEGTGSEQGNSIAVQNNNNIAFGGTTTYGAGNLDVYFVHFTYDSLATTYKLSLKYFKDTSNCLLSVPDEVIIPAGVKLFPNPMSTYATVLVQGSIGKQYSFSVYSESGQAIMVARPFTQTTHEQSVITFERGNLSAGIYIYEVLDQYGNKAATGKFIIE